MSWGDGLFSQELLTDFKVKLGLSSDSELLFFLKTEWGSQNPPHRDLIRTSLRQHLALSKAAATSISHSPQLGGYASLRGPDVVIAIGFDLEDFDRVKPPVVQRVCSTVGELEQAPSAAALWCAKEATFKALKGPHQPELLSDIQIINWQCSHNSQFETFQAKRISDQELFNIQGLTLKLGTHQFALALQR